MGLSSSLISASPSTRCHGSPNSYPTAKAKKKLKLTIWNQTPKHSHSPSLSVSNCEAVSTLKEWRSLWSDAATGQIGGSNDTGLFLIEKSLKSPLVKSPPVPTRFICDSYIGLRNRKEVSSLFCIHRIEVKITYKIDTSLGKRRAESKKWIISATGEIAKIPILQVRCYRL